MDDKNRTKLHIAILKSDKCIMGLLLRNNCDFLNDLDKDHYSPLGLAIKEEKYKFAYRLLLENNIKVDVRAG